MTEHPNLAAALVAALTELTVVDKGRTANAGSYSYDYADLADVVKLTRPVLGSHGLVALTPVHAHGDGLACSVILVHASGERMHFEPFPFPHGRDAQATGSMVTYHRRYALCAALGIAAGDDDDGHSAAPQQEPAKADHGTHEAIRSIVANLEDHDRDLFVAWWKDQRLPSIKAGDPLTQQQAEMVLDHLVSFEVPA